MSIPKAYRPLGRTGFTFRLLVALVAVVLIVSYLTQRG